MGYAAKSAHARAMYLNGYAQVDIARALGVSENTVANWKRQHEWVRSPTVLPAERKKAFQLFRDGQTQQAIAHALGVSENTINAWKKKDHWLARLALLQDKVLSDALSQLANIAHVEIARRAAGGAEKSAAALEQALAYVCAHLDRPDLAAPPGS